MIVAGLVGGVLSQEGVGRYGFAGAAGIGILCLICAFFMSSTLEDGTH